MSSNLFSHTVVFKLKDGVVLNNVTSAVQGLKDGFVTQYWGLQVENPGLFVWAAHFDSLQQRDGFLASSGYREFVSTWDQYFDVEEDQPTLVTQWTTKSPEVTKAMASPITEMVFFTIASSLSTSETKLAAEESMEWVLMAAQKYGGSTGAAIGWIENENELIAECLFGFESLEAHMKWREHPEFANTGKVFVEIIGKGLSVAPCVRIWSVDAVNGFFHVEFQDGERK